jgi:hypothetical protein
MLFMVIEHFKDVPAIAERFRREGRMLPEGVTYHASWVEPDGARCFQLMEADRADMLDPWIARWADLARFEVIPVLGSQQFWEAFNRGMAR